MVELSELLHVIYEDCLLNWKIEVHDHSQSIPGSMASVYTQIMPKTTTLYIILTYSELNLIKCGPYSNPLDKLSFITKMSDQTSLDNFGMSRTTIATYLIGDLEDFVSKLKQSTWQRYSNLVDEQIDEVLDVDNR